MKLATPRSMWSLCLFSAAWSNMATTGMEVQHNFLSLVGIKFRLMIIYCLYPLALISASTEWARLSTLLFSVISTRTGFCFLVAIIGIDSFVIMCLLPDPRGPLMMPRPFSVFRTYSRAAHWNWVRQAYYVLELIRASEMLAWISSENHTVVLCPSSGSL